jgi:hypothetical protein
MATVPIRRVQAPRAAAGTAGRAAAIEKARVVGAFSSSVQTDMRRAAAKRERDRTARRGILSCSMAKRKGMLVMVECVGRLIGWMVCMVCVHVRASVCVILASPAAAATA